MAEYRELLKIDSDSVMGQLGSGALLVKQGKIDDALVALRRAVELGPKEFEAHWALGRALMIKEQFVEAATEFEKAVALAPARADAHYQLGLALRRLGRTEEANREFATVERLNREFRTGTATKP
jgi:Flp pilus assembly protein TadD